VVVLTNKRMYRAFLLYGELRYIYKIPKTRSRRAPRRMARVGIALPAEARSSSSPARSANTSRACSPRSKSWISNGRLEALNSKVRLLSHRAYGFHSADALIAMIYLCCAGIQIALPHR
jgi:transposase